ncbi:hypothetical protein VTL71DRAFT_9586 [Oculimacula yallundae]|uniref:Uncharacterized protein n=1 Tax=Oculimacula yallundae TaxID=86028 RepID=A0ABR4BR89_9HELO
MDNGHGKKTSGMRRAPEELDFDQLFTSSDNLTCLELWNYEIEDSERNVAKYGPVVGNGQEILSRLEQEDHKDFSESLLIFFSEGTNECSDRNPYLLRESNPPFRVQKSTIQSIAGVLSLPMTLHLEMYVDGSTMFMDMGEPLCEDENRIQTFIIQNSFTTTGQYSASISYNLTTRTTGAFVHGLCDFEIKALVKKLMTRQNSIAFPMILPLNLLAFRADSVGGKVGDSHCEIIDIEHQTGIRTKWHPGRLCCGDVRNNRPEQRRYDGVDFDKVTADLTSFTSKLAYVEYVCEIHLPMLDTFDTINKRILQTYPEDRRRRLEKVGHRLHTESGMLRSSLQATYSRAKYLSKRGQVQVQTIYSLIAQKDNALSTKDNAALKTISEDQKRITLIAARDSAAMRVISVITTVFLPATFTATFFSTTFFDFPKGKSGIVSAWVWLYFLVTIVLSGFVIAWWYVSSRRRWYKIENEVGGLVVKIETMEARNSSSASQHEAAQHVEFRPNRK